MKVAIFGLGYVGCVSAACLARAEHRVIGVDVKAEKIDSIRRGECPIIEPGLGQVIADTVAAGTLEATDDTDYAVAQSDLAMICVGTPSQANGNLDLTYVENVCRQIGQAMANKNEYFVVVVRSTILPGSAEERLLPLLEKASGKVAGQDFGFCVNPEFLREGTALADFYSPPYTVIGELDARSGESVARLYNAIDAPVYRVALGIAEMVKYAGNAFHALKIAFANEIGNLSQHFGLDSHQVMEIFVQDTKLNLGPAYLKPGFAFGGSCLGKDLRALLHSARRQDMNLPVLESILPSNQLQIEKALEMLLREEKRKVGLLGLSFKSNTDDLRESPAIELAERLIGKGFDLYIYDREVSLSRLHGSNRAYFEQTIPHLNQLMRADLQETVEAAETIVVTKRLDDDEYRLLADSLRPDHTLIDLVRLNGQAMPGFQGEYRGICW